jgi:hypothetical protein
MYSFGGLLLYPLVLLGAGFAWVYVGGLRKPDNSHQESAA